MYKTKLSSLLRVGLSLLIIAMFLSATSTSTAYGSNVQTKTVTVTVRGEYIDSVRPAGNTLTCSSAKIELGKYKNTFWATHVDYSTWEYTAFCDLTFTNVPADISGWVTVYWKVDQNNTSSSMYMGWGENGGSMGSINLRASQNK